MSTDPWTFGWSAVSTLLTAVALLLTAVAVGASLFVVIRDTRRLNQMVAQDVGDRRRGQAVRVSAWATAESDYPELARENIVGNPWYASVHVLNSSDSSISEVQVEVGHRNLDGSWESLQETHQWVIVPPGAQVDATFTQPYIRNFSAPPHNALLCTVSFRDNNSISWRRDAFNELSEAQT